MSCVRPSELMNVTLCPVVIETCDGLTDPFEIVIVAPLGPGPVPDGTIGPPPPPSLLSPHAIMPARPATIATYRHVVVPDIRKSPP